MTEAARWFLWSLLAFTAALAATAPGFAQTTKVWDSPEGRLCFEEWRFAALDTLNGHSASGRFDAGKPYGLNEYGLWTFGDVQVTSVRPPSGWYGEYESNIYKWWWLPHRQEVGFGEHLEMRGQLFRQLGKRGFVRRCLATSGLSVNSLGEVSGDNGVATASGGSACADRPARGILAGTWKTNAAGGLSTLHFPTNGAGTYDSGASILGRLQGNVFDGCWIRTSSRVTCGESVRGSKHWGVLRFVFDADFQSFSGEWDYCGTGTRKPWTGKREGALPPRSTTAPTPGNRREAGVNRPGSDFHSFVMSRQDVEACRATCELHEKCRAWTYVAPGHQDPTRAKCWLKDSAPGPVAATCCTSGVVR